jgi:thiol:disulfide interchange protein DsbD
VALRLKMDKGWHTYWQNPGESGLPTTLAWKLPAGLTPGPIQWPPPRALPVGPLVNYGYEGEVLLLTDIAVTSAMSSAGPATLQARADWLVCREVCIPEGADLAHLPVAPQSRRTGEQSPARVRRCRARSPDGPSRDPSPGRSCSDSGADPASEIRFFPFGGQDRAERAADPRRDGAP